MHPNIEAMWGVGLGPRAVAGIFRGWSVAGLATPIIPWLVWPHHTLQTLRSKPSGFEASLIRPFKGPYKAL